MSRILDLVRKHELRRFAPGEIVLEQGTKTGKLFFLADGAVEVVKDGVLVTIASQPGAVFGEISAFLGCNHTATVRALQSCAFYVIGRPRAFLEDSLPIWMHVSESLARRLDAVNTYVVKTKQQFAERDHIEILNGVLEALMQRDPPRLIRVTSPATQPQQGPS